MQNHDLLRIFTKPEISKLSQDTLLKYRKEKLLLFQMTEKYTVRLNGHDVDKNTVIDIFTKLESTLENHLLQHKIPEIQEFLSSPDTTKFHLLRKVDFFYMSNSTKALVLDSIFHKINNQLGSDIINRKIGPDNIKQIVEFTKTHIEGNVNDTYSKVYIVLKDYVNDLFDKYEQPYEEKHLNSNKIEPEIIKILETNFNKKIDALPVSFEPIKYSFASWCEANVLQNAFSRNKEFGRFDKRALGALRNASYIASEYFQHEAHKNNAENMDNYLSNKKVNNTNESFLGTYGITIAIILFVLRMIVNNL